MKWIEPKFSTGNRFLAGWTQYHNNVPTKSTKPKIIHFTTIIFSLFLIYALVAVYMSTSDIEKITFWSGLAFVVSLVFSLIAHFLKEDLQKLAKNRSQLFLYNFEVAIPVWVTIALTTLTLSNEDIIKSELGNYKEIVLSAIILLVLLKFFVDYTISVNEHYNRKLENSTFTEVKSVVQKESK